MKIDGAYVSNFTINNCQFVETETQIRKISPEYLPDNIGGGNNEGGSSLPEVTTSDNGKS